MRVTSWVFAAAGADAALGTTELQGRCPSPGMFATPLEWPLRPLRHTLAMPFDCDHRRTFGPDVCPAACHAVGRGAFTYVRADKAGDLPIAEPGSVDVFVLDMNHGWPNIGHDADRHGGADGGLRHGRRHRRRRPARARRVLRRAARLRRPAAAGRTRRPLPRHRRTRPHRSGAERRRRRQPGDRRVGGVGIAALHALRRRPRPPRRGAHRHLPHLRRDEPLAGRRRSGAARTREGRQERRHRRQRADAGVRRPSLVRRARARRRRRAGSRRTHPRPRQPALRSAAAPVDGRAW